MTTHGVPGNRLLRHIGFVAEKCRANRWKLLGHVLVHSVRLPFFLSCVDVKAGTSAKIPGVVVSFNVDSTWRGVWANDN